MASSMATKRKAQEPSKAPTNVVSALHFTATVLASPTGRLIVRLPGPVSQQLPSRGQVAVDATLNDHTFETVLEPDGEFGHFVNVGGVKSGVAVLAPGHTASIELVPRRDWPEPEVPDDLLRAVTSARAEVRELWQAITPMARWEWVRWVNETKNPDTRQRRIDVSVSKLASGKRRPCCFNLASCTDPELARSGKLSLA